MTAIAAEVLADIDKDTVDFVENYDGTRMQPSVLPAKLPNLLINGSAGIAVGMATNIPPHNLGEVVRATQALIDDPDLTTAQLCEYLLGPDLPTGGMIFRYDRRRNPVTGQWEEVDAIRDMYAHGRGRVVMQAQVRLRGDAQRPHRHRGHGHPLPGQQGHPAGEDRRARQGRQDRRHRRPARRVGPRRHAHRHRVQEGRGAAQGAQQPLQAHAAQDGLQRQHRGPRRRPAPDAAAQGPPAAPHRVAPRCRAAAHRVRPAARRATGPTSSRASRPRSTTSTRSSAPSASRPTWTPPAPT